MTYWRVFVPTGLGGAQPGGLSGSLWVKEESGQLYEKDHWGRQRNPPAPLRGSVRQILRHRYGVTVKVEKAKLSLGEYHPRIWRPTYSPSPDKFCSREWTTSLQAARNLFLDMRAIFRCVEPGVGANSKAYGHDMRELLLLACTEVESAWKSILVANGYTLPKFPSTKDYVRLLRPLALDRWKLSLVMHPGFPQFRPFAGWSATAPTRSLRWYSAYNDVKHGREDHFDKATLSNLIHALGAVFVMISAQFGPWLPPYDGEVNGSNIPQFSPSSLFEQFAIRRTLWADDFVCDIPVWPLADTYVPPWCESGATWSPVPHKF
jgi:hypothetical protein